MIYDLQVLFDKGEVALAYQLEAMREKAPELEDDFDNLTSLILALAEEKEDAYDEGKEAGYDEGYSECEWDMSNEWQAGYDEGYEEGKDEGYDDGYDQGLEAGREE
jgi:flagellar biosynthesis/type III secretory pathway protein FliH